MRRRMLTSVVAAALLVSGTACSDDDGPATALADFLAGWPAGDLDGVGFLTPTGEPVPAGEVADAIAALSGDLSGQPPELSAADVSVQDDGATGEVAVAWPLPGGATWEYQTTVRLAERDGDWQVLWEPAVVHPELLDGDQLRLRRLAGERGRIVDRDGEPLMSAQPVTVVGIWPSRVSDLDDLVDRLDDAFTSLGHDLDLSDLPERVEAAREDDLFVDVVTLRQEEYQRVHADIGDLPGVRTQQAERHLAPTREFARALLGTVGEVTAEVMEEHPGVFEPGDLVGYGGLSEQYDAQLRGVVGQSVVIARPSPEDQETEIELDRVEPVAGSDLTVTLDPAVQRAAEQALSAESKPSALVALRVGDGSVLAVANTEGEQPHPVNLALTAAVPPGSTFKIVSGYRLLSTGEVSLDSPVACPEELTVEGFSIGNDFSGDRGEIPFQEAMAISCNTAFADLAPRMGGDGLAAAAAELGIGGDWDLGVETFTGSVPSGGAALDQAVAAFGQGQTQVSPVAMAAATAAVARGAWLPPTLVVDPAAGEPAGVELPDGAVADLHAALRAVVTGGTAEALDGLPGGDVYGKTGSAEAGEDTTHGWFVGWQGDLAVAVFVQDGESGSGAAVPLAERFLREVGD